MKSRPTRLLVATTIPDTAWTIMSGQLKYLQTHGFDVTLVSSPGARLADTAKREEILARAIPMRRELSIFADLRAIISLFRVIRKERIDLTYVGTPKAGLLAGLAAMAARTPNRIYLLRGLRLETESGWRRAVLWAAEWVAIHCAHHVVLVSPSLQERVVALRLMGRSRGVVLGRGGSNGVALDEFGQTAQHRSAGQALRSSLGIPKEAFVFGFVGRLTLDKGIRELAEAFRRLQLEHSDAWLVLTGSEELAGLPPAMRCELTELPNLRFTGWLDDRAPAYHAMDCLVLPTYREGLPNAPLEAAAAGKAVITTSATGAIDSILGEATGLLVRPRSAGELYEAMARLASCRESAARMGLRGQAFVSQHYTNEIVWSALVRFLDHAVSATEAGASCAAF